MQRPPELLSTINQTEKSPQFSGKASLAFNSLLSPTNVRYQQNSFRFPNQSDYFTPTLTKGSGLLGINENTLASHRYPQRATNFPDIISPRGPQNQWSTLSMNEVTSHNSPMLQKPMFNPNQKVLERSSSLLYRPPGFNFNKSSEPNSSTIQYSNTSFNAPPTNLQTRRNHELDTSMKTNLLKVTSNPHQEKSSYHSSYLLQNSAQEILNPEISFLRREPFESKLPKVNLSRNASIEKSFMASNQQNNSILHETSSFNISYRAKTKFPPKEEEMPDPRKNLMAIPIDQLIGLPQYQNTFHSGLRNDDEIETLKQRLNQVQSKPLLAVPRPSGNKKFAFSVPISKVPSSDNIPPIQKTSKETSPIPSLSKLNTTSLTERSRRRKENLSNQIVERPKNPKAKAWIKIWMWIAVAPTLLRGEIEKNTSEKRRRINLKAPETVKIHVNHAAKFIKDNSFKALEGLYELDHSINFLEGKKKSLFAKSANKKTVEARNKKISDKLIAILQEFKSALTTEEFPTPLVEYLASISENLTRIPTGFLFEFELVRLEFSQFSALKNMTPERSQMVIGMFVLVRMLVFYFLTQPWTATKKITETPLLTTNLKICSSVLYLIIMEYFRDRLPIIPNNQASIAPEKRLNPRNGPLLAFHEKEKSADEINTDDIIIGLYSKKELESYFGEEEKAVESMKALIDECLQTMYIKVHKLNATAQRAEH